MAALRFRFAPPTASHGARGNLALTINADHSVGAGQKAVDLLDEVVCLAIYGKRTLGDTLISIGADVGAEEPPAEVEIETDESRPALILVGTAALQTALRAGDLTVLVDAADGGGLYKVPRTYWNRRNPWGARALEGLDEDDENFGILRGLTGPH